MSAIISSRKYVNEYEEILEVNIHGKENLSL